MTQIHADKNLFGGLASAFISVICGLKWFGLNAFITQEKELGVSPSLFLQSGK